ncbi:hypothetical protein FJZ53_04135 [Candidatus Woesearchaeota archaeon]|nr:hypothetical protein [Candidatus Woesearchaeota archaeon]
MSPLCGHCDIKFRWSETNLDKLGECVYCSEKQRCWGASLCGSVCAADNRDQGGKYWVACSGCPYGGSGSVNYNGNDREKCQDFLNQCYQNNCINKKSLC